MLPAAASTNPTKSFIRVVALNRMGRQKQWFRRFYFKADIINGIVHGSAVLESHGRIPKSVWIAPRCLGLSTSGSGAFCIRGSGNFPAMPGLHDREDNVTNFLQRSKYKEGKYLHGNNLFGVHFFMIHKIISNNRMIWRRGIDQMFPG